MDIALVLPFATAIRLRLNVAMHREVVRAPSSPPARIKRIAGALAGAALGDALGRPCELLFSHERIQRRYGYVQGFVDRHAGHTTDDTQLTRLMLEAVIEGTGAPVASDLGAVMLRRLRLRDCFNFLFTLGRVGLFINPYVSLLKLKLGVPAHWAGRWNPLVAADELAMCAAPLGCARPADAEAAIGLARELGRVINFGIAIEGGAAMAGAIALALGDELSMEQITREIGARVPLLGKSILAACEAGRSAQGDYEAFVRTSVRAVRRLAPFDVREAVPLALAVVGTYGGEPMDAIFRAVNLGRDADTLAGMVGAVVGARYGIDALNAPLLQQVESRMHYDFVRDAEALMAACLR